MPAYYNDNDAFCCAWLRELIKAGHIPEGDVDERPIQEVRGSDLEGYAQVHLFAGIGGWAYALRLADWPADEPVWTGSCPCPPFSQAGSKIRCPACEGRNLVPHPYRTGHFVCCECGHEWLADGRHLWPEFRRLLEECRPRVVFGEQVAGSDGRVWLAGVHATLEALGYAVGRADLPAACLAAPHIRQRLWWVADAEDGYGRANAGDEAKGEECGRRRPSGSGDAHGLEHAEHGGREGRDKERPWPGAVVPSGQTGGLDDAGGERAAAPEGATEPGGDGTDDGVSRPAGSWDSFDLVPCADGKARRVEPGTFPLAHGVPGRVGRLRGYGNAVVPQVAAEFIRAWREAVMAQLKER